MYSSLTRLFCLHFSWRNGVVMEMCGDDFILNSCGKIGDAIRALNQLKSESQDFKEINEIEEKNELHGEKLVLKAEKAKMEPQVKSMMPGFKTPHPAACQAEGAKMPVFPGSIYHKQHVIHLMIMSSGHLLLNNRTNENIVTSLSFLNRNA
ncbi:hypothetical protein Hanom_Chr04g00292081 [Helianthus anomalus]